MIKPHLLAAGLGFGAAGLIFVYLGLMFAALYLLLLIPLALRGGLPVLAGILIGFGGIWTALTLSQLERGGSTGDGGPWLAMGLVPLLAGAGLLAIAGFRSRQAPDEAEPDALP